MWRITISGCDGAQWTAICCPPRTEDKKYGRLHFDCEHAHRRVGGDVCGSHRVEAVVTLDETHVRHVMGGTRSPDEGLQDVEVAERRVLRVRKWRNRG